MVIYLSSEKGNILEESSLVVKRYDKWKCDIQKFIKEEYVNISNADCEMIVVDVYAVEKAEEILYLKNAFRKSVIVMLIPEDYRGTYPEGIDIIIKDENTDERLLKLINPKNTAEGDITKIGIWSDNDKLSIQFAVSLLSFFYKKIDDICLVEISDEFILGNNLKQYKLKDKEGIKYKDIPIVHNAMPDNCRIGVFTFIKRDSKRLFDMCDIPIEVISEKRIKVGNKSYNVSYSSRNYFKRNNTVFYKIFQEFMTKQKSRRIENGLQIIKEQRRKIFFAASIILAILILTIALRIMISGSNKSYVQETTSNVLETVTKESVSNEMTTALLETTSRVMPSEITVTEKMTEQKETAKRNKKKREKVKKIPEIQSVVPKQQQTDYKAKEKVTEKVTVNQSQKMPKEKIEVNGSSKEKIENYGEKSNKEKVE